MKVDNITMIGLLRGKCIPRDIKVNESLAAYLVRQFDSLHERAEAAERERDELKHIQEHNVKIKQAMNERFKRAERERDEFKALAEGQSELAGRNAARVQKAEEEIARRDAAASEPVGLQCMGDSGKWQDCASREVAESLGFTQFRELCTEAPPAVLPPEKITEIMQDLWNEFCDDTGCYPDDFEYQNEQLFFDAGRWAMLVAERISSLGAQPQKHVVLPADRTDDKSVSTFDSEKFYDAGWNSRGKADKEALDAANVKWEVKE
ncbi:hypothetical protein H8S21_10695 [Erwinia persicina]|uniref:hypothetical protein n=1 Tax=Erwinia persicina TaxID=55211 RepID=UPI0016548495|nr:hypothetical protein [Erwinia persicina]